MTFEKTAKILAEYKDIDVSEISLDSTFEDLGLDSLDTVEIVMSLEDEFGISIELDSSLKTVRELVELIDGSL
ncbi:MAG: acyl carrier protein [Clostridiaceae bacterium]|nr:acyl carrier protein [Clostridiaceae bacterium]MDD6274672.1 acyl carrier protein [Clostridiaceae bacterium]